MIFSCPDMVLDIKQYSFPPTCNVNYVSMQHKYANTCFIYVNVHYVEVEEVTQWVRVFAPQAEG